MNENFSNISKNYKLTGKLIALALMVGISWIATLFVWGVIEERESRQQEAAVEISDQWSRPQTIAGPVLTIPIEKKQHEQQWRKNYRDKYHYTATKGHNLR